MNKRTHDGHDYPGIARTMAGPGNEAAVKAIAEHLHYNESLHMHDMVGSSEPCSYCWLRAGKAVQAIIRSGLILIKTDGVESLRSAVKAVHDLTRTTDGDDLDGDSELPVGLFQAAIAPVINGGAS